MKNGKFKKYAGLNEKYLHNAEILLNDCDLSQASEKLWGAFATTAKAAAARHGKEIKTHDGISHYRVSISMETKR